ncbi:hypothetical protein CDD83_666 [Cordyceps sp. RAO-2017]|nr:hypothetical protein CDD83_666 [Cordyceps sp. RAO-2017]
MAAHVETTDPAAVPLPRCLPPGFTADRFRVFVPRLAGVVGRENVTVIGADMPLDDGDYQTVDCLTHDMHFLYDRGEFVGSAITFPRSAGEVQAVVSLCNELGMPIWTVSRGHNIGYGGAAPRVPGSLVLNMGRHMNRILEVNADECWCLLEPGVSYIQLYEYLAERGLQDRLWLDSPELGFGSVIGNALDHGVGFTPYGDHWMVHCGMEVVLANGDIVRTGMGAMSSPEGRQQAREGVAPVDQKPNDHWQLFPYGFGPITDGLFSMSNNGIVTKMGMWVS